MDPAEWTGLWKNILESELLWGWVHNHRGERDRRQVTYLFTVSL